MKQCLKKKTQINPHIYDKTWNYSQSTPESVFNGSFKNKRYIGDSNTNAFILLQLKFTITNCQVVDLQTRHEETTENRLLAILYKL